MREDTYIEHCRQRVCATLERGRRAQLQCGGRRPNECDSVIPNSMSRIQTETESRDAISPPGTPDPETDIQRRWEKALRADIKPYAQALNLSFAHAMLVFLPRDIRDRIYAILASSSTKITVCDGKLPRHIRTRCNVMDSYQSLWTLPDLKHYFDPLYVGRVVAREMAEAHYSTNTFYFDHHDPYLVHKFLTIDRFGYALSPMELVRNVEIVLDASLRCLCIGTALAHHGLACTGVSSKDAIQWCLERLFGLTARPVRIKIIILFAGSTPQTHERFREYLLIILRFVDQCRKLSFRFAFGVFGGREWNIDDTVEGGVDKALQQVLEMEDPFRSPLHRSGR